MLTFTGLTWPFRICDRVVRTLRAAGWRPQPKKRFAIQPSGWDHPLELRFDSSDRHVFEQVILQQEYKPVRECRDVKLIVDCGAYAGLSGRYFLQHFPNAHLVCLEPNPDNFALLQRNLRYFDARVTLMNRGLWSHTAGLRFGPGTYRDGREWSFQVTECQPGETPDLEAVGMEEILKQFPGRCIDLLKIDIERAEIEVFGNNTDAWLPHVRNIAVELHDQECRSVFEEAMVHYRYEAIRHGDLTLCMNISAR